MPRLDGVSAEELGRLFPEPSDTAPLLSLLQESGIDGFQLRSIVVFKKGTPILLLPLFESSLDLPALAKGWMQKPLKVAAHLVPSFFRPHVLGVGLLEGGWSEIGLASQLDATTVEAAWKMALGALQALATELKSDLVSFYNFKDDGNKLSSEVFRSFHRVPWLPGGRLPVSFDSLDDYLNHLSSAARRDLRRKMRASPEVRVTRSRQPSPVLDRIYELYLETVERAAMAVGVHNRLFFEKICERVPGAEYILYFVHDKLAAFNLVVAQRQAMVDKYFCMDYEIGCKYHLYFLSWLENIRYCVEHAIPLYLVGQGAQTTKAHLGAELVQNFLLFKHRQPAIDNFLFKQPAVVGKVLRYLGFWPDVSLPGDRR
jgi:hypothetical protein